MMTDFPEKIWVTHKEQLSGHVGFRASDLDHSTVTEGYYPEYIRADLVPQWRPIDTAPKTGELVLLRKIEDRVYLGSWTTDFNFPDEEPQWFDNTYNDFSTGYSSCPLEPTHWMPIPKVPE